MGWSPSASGELLDQLAGNPARGDQLGVKRSSCALPQVALQRSKRLLERRLAREVPMSKPP